jgi:lysozyme
MTTINRKVLDISHHNDVTSWPAVRDAGIVGIIHKATEGSSFTDDQYERRRDEAKRAGLLWGAYHFATDSDPEHQVEHFLQTTGIDDETLYALDWEDYGDDTMSEAQAREFMELVDEATERRCVLYGGNTIKEALGPSVDEFFGSHRLWLCQYGSSPVAQPSWDDYWLWQYSDGEAGPGPHGCPGVTGYVDTNSWAGTDIQLLAEWSGVGINPPQPTPRPPHPRRPTVVSLQTSGPAIVLVNGRLAVPGTRAISRRGEVARGAMTD